MRSSSRPSPPPERLRSVNPLVTATMRASVALSSGRRWERDVAHAARIPADSALPGQEDPKPHQ